MVIKPMVVYPSLKLAAKKLPLKIDAWKMNFQGWYETSTPITRRIHATGIFTYMKG